MGEKSADRQKQIAARIVGRWSNGLVSTSFHQDGTATRRTSEFEEDWTWSVTDQPGYEWILQRFPSPTGYYLILTPAGLGEDVLTVPQVDVILDVSNHQLVLQRAGLSLETGEPSPPRCVHREAEP